MLKRNLLLVFFTMVIILQSGTLTYVIAETNNINAIVVDQQQTTYNTSEPILTVATYQSFTPSVDSIVGIDFYIYNENTENPAGRNLDIILDDADDGLTPLVSGTIDLSGLAESSVFWLYFAFSSLSITIGETYYIFLSDSSYTAEDHFNWAIATSDVYAGGIWSGNPLYDGTFRTYYDDSPVHEFHNISVFLLGGLMSLILLINRGKKRS